MDRKQILILTADVGFGHRKAANAIAAALDEVYGDRFRVSVVNPLDDKRTPAFLRSSQADYDRLVREMPDVYKWPYHLSDATVPTTVIERALTVMLFNVMQDILKRYKPDVVITTHPLYPAPLSAAIAFRDRNIPFITVVTDLAMVHRLWFNTAAERCLVPTELASQQAAAGGFPEDKVMVTGIPVHPDLANEQRPPSAIRAALGWRTDLTTVLAVGSKRVKNLVKVLHVLNHSALPIQLVLVAGGDDRLYEQFCQTEWHGTARRYNYVENLAPFLCAADCIITKAGGLIVTESMASGLPMLLVDVTPGQEEGNADYIINHGAAEKAVTPVDALEILFHWLDDGHRLLYERKENAKALGRPRSAYAVVDIAALLVQNGPFSQPESRRSRLPKLRELLNQFGVRGEYNMVEKEE